MMRKRVPAIAFAAFGLFAAPVLAHADTVGQTSCGYNAQLANAEYAEQHAALGVSGAKQVYLDAATNGYPHQDIDLINYQQAVTTYNQAVDNVNQMKATAEAACQH
ncbi:hypothetical protein ACIP5Y_21500 [Nocardia sp. NPDC088792]|uniref:hypothetical protein n=1 Tax=Nocardia sp. NPDC088792 TaxID=3364332 RepID=UPI00380E4B29